MRSPSCTLQSAASRARRRPFSATLAATATSGRPPGRGIRDAMARPMGQGHPPAGRPARPLAVRGGGWESRARRAARSPLPRDRGGARPRQKMMRESDLYFVIPTYRLRDVGETVEQYDEHFWRNGHSPTMIVFDDSSPVAQEKYYPLAGADADAQRAVLRGAAGEGAVPRLPQPAAAGQAARRRWSRTCSGRATAATATITLMYTLGGLMVCSDDDMRPYALMEDSPRVARRRRGLPRPAAQGRPKRLHPQVVRHPGLLPRRAGQAGRPRCRTTTSAASCSSTPRWTWRPTPPRGCPARTR